MILSWLHYLGFATAFGGGTAVWLLLARLRAAPDAAPHLRPAIFAIASLGLSAIALLWLTGLAMWIDRHGATMALGPSWHLKLTAAAVLTGLAGFAWLRMKTARPLPPPVARAVVAAQLAAAATAIAAAIVTFAA